MKKILLACGSGIATSTAVNGKISTILDEAGYKGQYEIVQCKIAETMAKAPNFDFLIATTMAPAGLPIPFVSGIPFLTGMGLDAAKQQVLDLMEQ